MCLILLSFKQHRRYPLVIAANRDEFYNRASAPAAFWEEAPEMLAGRDLVAGGTWFGVTKSGRIAAITNYREPGFYKMDAPSRGMLVTRYLLGDEGPEDFLGVLDREAQHYNGFSLIIGDPGRLYYFSNRAKGFRELNPGVYGLSNRLMDTPWPKVEQGKRALAEVLAVEAPTPEDLFTVLADRTRPDDRLLPDTGVGLEWERILAPRFITSPIYGTRSSTALLVGRDAGALFVEKVFNSGPGPIHTGRFELKLSGAISGGPSVSQEGCR